ncbi:putative toxin-antitoxin system toxin component, PIN family [Nostoc sp.]|uniref:putative toxin-antitoxin system toxin component, PIN family n=1 Tax=Nostoc sp. TaxID=1180 RepID=UPI002FF22FD4
MGASVVMLCPRVVIDTNIIISALIFGGRVSRLRLAWQDDLFTPLVSKATTTELIRVLAYPKFKLTPTEQEDLLSDYILDLLQNYFYVIVMVWNFASGKINS